MLSRCSVRLFRVCLNLGLLIALSAGWVRAQPVIGDAAGLMGLINPQCADFRILGPCSCTGAQVDQACLQVAYHQPAYVVETVPIPRRRRDRRGAHQPWRHPRAAAAIPSTSPAAPLPRRRNPATPRSRFERPTSTASLSCCPMAAAPVMAGAFPMRPRSRPTTIANWISPPGATCRTGRPTSFPFRRSASPGPGARFFPALALISTTARRWPRRCWPGGRCRWRLARPQDPAGLRRAR